MIRAQELVQWTADADRQERTRHAALTFSNGWRNGPVHSRFEQAFGSEAWSSAETAAQIACTILRDDDWLGTLVHALAAELRADAFFEPPFPNFSSDIHRGLAVFSNGQVGVAAGVTRASELGAKKNMARGATSITFSGQMVVLKFVKAGDAVVSLWEAPRIDETFTAQAAGRCRRAEERKLVDGDILVVDGRFQSYVIEHVRSNMLIVQVEFLVDRAPLSVEYDSETLDYVGCSATDDGASRIQMMTTLLRKLGHEEAFEAVAAFLDHPNFFVRWHVMRELLGIDAGRALPLLRHMTADDPHPDARQAAVSVLPRLEAALTQQEAA